MQKCLIALCLVPCGHLCCHPWQVLLVLKPECFMCFLMFEIWVLFFALQPEIQIMLISHVFLTSHPGINDIKRIEKAGLTFSSSKRITLEHIAYTYIFQHTTILPVQRTLKEFLPILDQGKIATKRDQEDWHQQELWLHWQVNSDRFDIQSPSFICDPTIVNDPKRTPTIVSLSEFQGLLEKILLNHVLCSRKKHDEVLHPA